MNQHRAEIDAARRQFYGGDVLPTIDPFADAMFAAGIKFAQTRAAAELARLHKLIDSLNTDYSALQSLHDARTAPYTAEIERLQARNAELTDAMDDLRTELAKRRGE